MFEQTFKNIDDILWKDSGCSTELDYAEQSSWILFLKWLDDYEKDLIKERGSTVAHNPMSNLKLGSGIAPVQSLLERQVNVTIGTDGAISGNDLDMWLSMRLAATLPKGALMKPDIVPAKEVIEMVTLNGARALGKANHLGSLELGKKADIIVVSTNAIHAAPLFDPLTHLVYSSAKSDVKDVFVDGFVTQGCFLMRTRLVSAVAEVDCV